MNVLVPSDRYRYSLFGTLDVAADTQVIRVEPLADSIQLGAPPELGAEVYLQNVDTGEQIPLRDSFATVGGGVAQVHNLWTAHAIRPATTYRVVVRRNGEEATTATTTTPAHPPTLRHEPDSSSDRSFLMPCAVDEEGNPFERRNTFTLRARGVEAIAAVEVFYPIESAVLGSQAVRGIQHYEDVQYEEERQRFRISIFYARDLISLNSRGRGCLTASAFARPHASVAVTAGGPDWPAWRGAPLNEFSRPDAFTNVEGGHGFVGGVYTDTIDVPIRSR